LNRKAHGSVSSFHHGISSSKLASLSNPSLESQLARDFAAQAKVASGSTSSLGQLPNASGIFGPAGGLGSAPTSPYGHPKGVAVAHGVGMGRAAGHDGQGVVLPSIRNWDDGNGHGQQGINPMFRVVSRP
jgi:meiosis induction protein kinase IME2/SME1